MKRAKTGALRKRVEKYFHVFGKPDGTDMGDLLSDLDPTLKPHELEDELKNRGIDLSRLDKRAPEEFGDVEIVVSRLNPYGYVYFRKKLRSKLPFKSGDRVIFQVLDDIVVIYPVRGLSTSG